MKLAKSVVCMMKEDDRAVDTEYNSKRGLNNSPA